MMTIFYAYWCNIPRAYDMSTTKSYIFGNLITCLNVGKKTFGWAGILLPFSSQRYCIGGMNQYVEVCVA